MKIAIIIPTIQSGGAEKLVSTLSKKFNELYDLSIIVYDSRNPFYEYHGEIINLNIISGKNKFTRLINFFKKIYKIKKIKRKRKFDVVLSIMDGANIVNILSKENERVITSIHTMISKRKKNIDSWLFKNAARILYSKSDQLVVVSNAIKNELVQTYNINPEIITTIYNPIDEYSISEMAKYSINANENKIFESKIIINIGRLEEVKGQIHLIRVFSEIHHSIPNLKLVILGEGSLREKLILEAQERGIENKVHILGFKSNPFNLLKHSDVYVHTSYFEGFGNVLIEAMYVGLPVISVNCSGGPFEILSGNNYKIIDDDVIYGEFGILTPELSIKDLQINMLSKNEKKLKKSILDVLNSESLMNDYSNKSKLRSKYFSEEISFLKWIEVLEVARKE